MTHAIVIGEPSIAGKRSFHNRPLLIHAATVFIKL